MYAGKTQLCGRCMMPDSGITTGTPSHQHDIMGDARHNHCSRAEKVRCIVNLVRHDHGVILCAHDPHRRQRAAAQTCLALVQVSCLDWHCCSCLTEMLLIPATDWRSHIEATERYEGKIAGHKLQD